MRKWLIGLAALASLAVSACAGVTPDDDWRPPTREECRAAQQAIFGCPGQISGP